MLLTCLLSLVVLDGVFSCTCYGGECWSSLVLCAKSSSEVCCQTCKSLSCCARWGKVNTVLLCQWYCYMTINFLTFCHINLYTSVIADHMIMAQTSKCVVFALLDSLWPYSEGNLESRNMPCSSWPSFHCHIPGLADTLVWLYASGYTWSKNGVCLNMCMSESAASACGRERGPLVLSDRGIRSKGGIYLSLSDFPVSGLLLRLLHRLLC